MAAALRDGNAPKLEYINLHRNDIGDEGLKALSEALGATQSLRSIDFLQNHIGDEGVAALAKSRCAAGLKTLHLDGADDLTDESLTLLSFACKSLEALYVAECRRLTGEGITNAARALPVRSMSLRGTGLSRSGAFRVLGILHAR